MRMPAAALLLWACLGAPGCGEGPAGRPAGPEEAAGPPAAREAPGEATLLARLVAGVEGGPGLRTQQLSDDAGFLRALLWPDLAAPGAEVAAMAHMRATLVAGSLSAEIGGDGAGRPALARRDPFGLSVRDAWLEVARKGPGAYRAWCAEEAPRLFRQRDEDLQRLFERPLR